MELHPYLLQKITQTLAGFPKVRQTILFGSRARGDADTGSDIDLALQLDTTPENATLDFMQASRALKDLPLVYKIDTVLLDPHPTASAGMIANIKRDGIVIYERAAADATTAHE